MRVYIVSDFHLCFNPNNKEKASRTEKVLAFLEYLKGKADMLILAGDIFDLWYDWKKVIIKGYFPVLKKLAELEEQGCKLIYISGNHDFWFGDFFKQYLNADLYQNYFSDNIDGKRLFVAHGDKYTSNDYRYRIFRYLVRTPFVRGLFSIFHPEIALEFGNLLSRTSRSRNSDENESESRRTDGLVKYAESIADKYDIIVMGHSHKPKEVTVGKSLYLNAGDWVLNGSYVSMIEGKPELCYH